MAILRENYGYHERERMGLELLSRRGPTGELNVLQQVTMQKFKLSGRWQIVIAIICHLLLNFNGYLEQISS